MSSDNMSDANAEELWIAEQRRIISAYLVAEDRLHGQIGEWPAWHLQPYLAIWAVESLRAPGRVGWWAISGDVPADYVSFHEADHPRKAMLHFARHWSEVGACMLRGDAHPTMVIGKSEQWPELGHLLSRRANLLRSFAEYDSLWKS